MHELAYSARDFTAEEAAKMGLVSRVVKGGRDEVLAAALDTARCIAQKSPIAVLGTKQILQHARDHTYELIQLKVYILVLKDSVLLQGAREPRVRRYVEQCHAAEFGERLSC